MLNLFIIWCQSIVPLNWLVKNMYKPNTFATILLIDKMLEGCHITESVLSRKTYVIEEKNMADQIFEIGFSET
jgi:hypothetical protein